MTWEPRIFDRARPGVPLIQQVDALLDNQRATWKRFQEGEQMLSRVQSKVYQRDNGHIVVQANPVRQKSIQAKVDAASISKRPCFLCSQNMPPEERGIAFDNLIILPNPYPVHRRHLTIPTRQHCPQRIQGMIPSLLKLTQALGSEMLVFYNGPRCGASAPDHFHFQACQIEGIPLIKQLAGIESKASVFPWTHFGRNLLVCRDSNARNIEECLTHILDELKFTDQETTHEPMVNIICSFHQESYQAVLFPRKKHRPACYFSTGDLRISVSPAALEMAGILMVAESNHMDRIDEPTALSIYQEVSLDNQHFAKLVEALS